MSGHQLVRVAERVAEGIIDDARGRKREIRAGAEDYADDILDTLEVNLSRFAQLDFTGVAVRNAAGAGQRPRSANGSDVASAGRSAGVQRSRSLTRPW